MTASGYASDGAQQPKPIKFWHLQIGDDKLSRPLGETLQGLFAVNAVDDIVVSEMLQTGMHQHARRPIIVDNKNAKRSVWHQCTAFMCWLQMLNISNRAIHRIKRR